MLNELFINKEDYEGILKRLEAFINNNDEELSNLLNAEKDKATKKLGHQEVKKIWDAMNSATRDSVGLLLGSQIEELSKKWPTNLTFDRNEPLSKKAGELLKGGIEFKELQKSLENDAETGAAGLTFFNIQLPEDFILLIAMPRSLMNKKSEVIRTVLSSTSKLNLSKEEISRFNSHDDIFITSMVFDDVRFENHLIRLVRRKLNSSERHRHSLQALGQIGFPTPKSENEKILALKNQQLADEIRKSQIRFLNKRGVRVPLNGQFKELGYSHIDFHKDADDPEKILVKIFVGDMPYSVKLDKYLNFDFEGKRFDVPFLHDALKFTLLSFLKPILCEEKVKTPSGELKEIDTEVVSRMGHLRWLTHGQHYSQKAESNCFEFEGKDLCALALERQERHKGTEKEKMETTYVRPVVEKEENLPPIVLHLSGVL